MDALLARASTASHRINNYTGTDFSGIEALRGEIMEQEKEVRSHRAAVADAKTSHAEAQEKQSASQKEIVGLLESKSSWSPADLERYMSLVRSEHLDEQAEQRAREQLSLAERRLELARSLLEKLERKQYHEEQIWSDTIRRNSTWVTIGLMGVNIILLLAQISIFEPYRRRKIVNQIKQALDEKSAAIVGAEQQIDAVVEASGSSAERPERLLPASEIVETQTDPVVLLQDQSDESVADPVLEPVDAEHVRSNTSTGLSRVTDFASQSAASIQRVVHDLFSQRIIEIQKREVTTLALQGVATGMTIAALLCLTVLSPR